MTTNHGGLDLLCTRHINVISKETAAWSVFTLCVYTQQRIPGHIYGLEKQNPQNSEDLVVECEWWEEDEGDFKGLQ